jgi:hypothetical protein
VLVFLVAMIPLMSLDWHFNILEVPKRPSNPQLPEDVVPLEGGCELPLPTYHPMVAMMEQQQQEQEGERQRVKLN